MPTARIELATLTLCESRASQLHHVGYFVIYFSWKQFGFFGFVFKKPKFEKINKTKKMPTARIELATLTL